MRFFILDRGNRLGEDVLHENEGDQTHLAPKHRGTTASTFKSKGCFPHANVCPDFLQNRYGKMKQAEGSGPQQLAK